MSEGNFEKREQPEYSLHSFISSCSRCDDNQPPRSSDGPPLEMKMMGSNKRSPSWSVSLGRPSLNKPYLRYYAVGPSTYQILCPLCQQRSATQTVELIGIFGPFTCLLSSLSCCFPLFSLSLVYLCLQNRYKSKRLFCSKCGGHLGFYSRPK